MTLIILVFIYRRCSSKSCTRRALLEVDLPDVARQRAPVTAPCDSGRADGEALSANSPARFGAFVRGLPRDRLPPFSCEADSRRLRCRPARPPARPFDPLPARPLQTPPSLTPSTTRSGWLPAVEKAVPSGVGAVEARCEAVRVSDGRPVAAVARHEATERAGKRPFRDGERAAAT